ncbi:MAG: XdhC family protein [Methanopyraceae archaeon]
MVEPEALLTIYGGGHVGAAVARLASYAGFRVTVVDDRPEYADPARYPEGVHALRRSLDDASELPLPDERTCVVVATRSHETDRSVMVALAGTPAPYVGLLGSRRKWEWIRAALEEGGADPSWVAGVRTPAGLDLGGETPEEIAVEILAEIVRERNRGRKTE